MPKWKQLAGVLKAKLDEIKSEQGLHKYMTQIFLNGYICTKCDSVLGNIRSRNQHIKRKKQNKKKNKKFKKIQAATKS